MPKKRKSGGRSKGKKGISGTVTCAACGKVVPRDKAKKRTAHKSFVDRQIYRELRNSGATIARSTTITYYCVNCAVHRGIAGIRSKKDRKTR